MPGKNTLTLAFALILLALLSALSGCGSNSSSLTGTSPGTATASPPNTPDSLEITIDAVNLAGQKKPHLTLRGLSQVHQFYQTLLALPAMPEHMGCTDELGPHYQLTFKYKSHTLAQALAKRDGCRPVTISGEKGDRRASQIFWTQLDQAIVAATPIPKPAALAIQHALAGNQPALTARLADASATQRLYSAILALPVEKAYCNDQAYPEYRLVFETAKQAIPASISHQCNTITLVGNFQSPGGTFRLNPAFQQLFTQILAMATFAPAQPDQLTKAVDPLKGAATEGQVADLALARQFYADVFALQQGEVGKGCPPISDKVNGTATWYTFSFTQWNLPIMTLTVYEGSCKLIQPAPGLATDQTLLGDASFWNMIHTVASV